jgi:phosphoglycerol transferase MdoB-like AlkP superfamily enzyme
MNKNNNGSTGPERHVFHGFRSVKDKISNYRALRQRLECGEDRGVLKSGLIRLCFIVLFGCLFAAMEALLFEEMSFWGVIASASMIGVAFWVVSLFFTFKRFFRMFLWLSGPLFSMLLTEVLVGNISAFPLKINLNFTQAVLNLVWYYIIALLLYLAIGKANLSAGIAAGLSFLWGNINCYVFRFRGRIILPADLLSVGTAVQVQDNYDWTPSLLQWIIFVVFLGYLGFLIVTSERGRPRPRLRFAIPSLIVCAAFIVAFFGTPFLSEIGIKPAYWYTQNNGVLLNFCTYLKYSYTDKPEGYSEDILLKSGYVSDGVGGGPEKPNIIVVMNESFSDLNVLGRLDTNDDCMPFFRGLEENTIRGYAYTSVLGGNTANAEYEFLTGNTTAFLPEGTIPYQMYTAAGDYSLSGQLAEIGYRTVAMHPYKRSCWNRMSVYRNYEFSETYFEDDYLMKGIVRNYIGDQYNYEKLISVYEEHRSKEPDVPVFIFNVTMQNHGGYLKEWVNLDRSVYLTGGYADKYPATDQYLSLIRESDEAFEMLINYFKGVDEPTIVVMFGDHQPKLEGGFYYDVLGKHTNDLTPEELQILYKVPFVIWANYDIKEQDGILTSLNYLQTYILETAELPITGYQKFLRDLREDIPIVNTIGFCERNLGFTAEETALSDKTREKLQMYRIIQYNGVFDRPNRVDGFFYLNRTDDS